MSCPLPPQNPLEDPLTDRIGDSGTSQEPRKGSPSSSFSSEVPCQTPQVPVPLPRPQRCRDSKPMDTLHESCKCLGSQTSKVNTKMTQSEKHANSAASERRLHEEHLRGSTERKNMGPKHSPLGTHLGSCGRESIRVGGGGCSAQLPPPSRRPCPPCTTPSGPSLFTTFVLCLLLAGVAEGSEFPDRECCDSVPPPPPTYHVATSTTTTTTPTPPQGHNASTHTGEYSNCTLIPSFLSSSLLL